MRISTRLAHLAVISMLACVLAPSHALGADPDAPADSIAGLTADFDSQIRPFLQRHCLECHSASEPEADVDLQRFVTIDRVRQDLRTWVKIADVLQRGAMPPEDEPQPNPAQRQRAAQWARRLLAIEIQARAGDPGRVLLRRLSNAEYNYTVRDLTGIDLKPAKLFPADAAGGEGFTNTGESLFMMPELLPKYLAAARQTAAHAVLVPDDIRFSASSDLHEWTVAAVERIRTLYRKYADEKGIVPLNAYIEATLQFRERRAADKLSFEKFARQQGLSPKYLKTLWNALHDGQASGEMVEIRERWNALKLGEARRLTDLIRQQQKKHWKFNKPKGYAKVDSLGLFGRYVVDLEPSSSPVTSDSSPDSSSGAETDEPVGRRLTFRDLFPLAVCFAHVVPVNVDVTVELYHREDEPLCRLMLNAEEVESLNKLWAELMYVSRAPAVEAYSIKEFVKFQPADRGKHIDEIKTLVEPLAERAAKFEQQVLKAEPKHLEALLDLGARAYRRPLKDVEQAQLLEMYRTFRAQQRKTHDQAVRAVLTRILVSPNFLYRIERPAPGEQAAPVSDWELATRLSYFLWSSMPDAELRRVAGEGRLQDAKVLETQARRMLKDPRTRGMSVEFVAQWLRFHGFDEHQGKSETRFPTFDQELRGAIYEESLRFCEDLIRNDRSVLDVLKSDHTFLNETLAKHYDIPDIRGPEWRRVDGVRHYQRGGVLAMSSVLATQSGALRTSPVLRGHWIVETLLGRELPNPPDNVPQLPDDETDTDGLSMRQLVEKHRSVATCAACHQKMDPFGFALEAYDPIGRLREKDLNGNAIDSKVETEEGTTFEGLPGLQDYLLKHQDEFLRQFCRKLVGYALGRAVDLTDGPLIDEMVDQLRKRDYRFSAAVLTLVHSKQFRYHRGLAAAEERSQ